MSNIKITDDNLVGELKNRDPLAFEYMMDTYTRSVYCLVYRILNGLGSAEDIEECVSDVFVEAWKTIEKFNENRAAFKTWLLILAKYKSLDYKRRFSAKFREETVDESLGDSGETVENICIMKEQLNEAVNIINNFEEPDRTIFYRRYFLYEKIEHIAKCIGLTEGAVYKRLWRSRNLLREVLKERCD